MSDPNSNEALLATARERARDGATYWKDNWEWAEDDLKFLSGEQWPPSVKSERELEQRPCLVNNVLPTFIDQVMGDQLQNKPSIKVSAVDPASVDTEEGEQEELKISNRAGKKDYSLGEVFTGAIKNIEYNCDAETAYDMAFQSALESGIGFLRVLSDYANEETFDQELLIKHISDQFSVIIDPNAREIDKSDAGWVIVDDNMPKDAFKEQYPGVEAEALAGSTDQGEWYTEKTVRVSEYFTRELILKEQSLLSDGRLVWAEDLEPILDELAAQGITVKRSRKVKTYKVIWRKITGNAVLEGPIELHCTTIPIVPVWGKSITIKKKTIYRSLIRYSKDAQRMANYWDSAAAESIALAPKAPFIGAEGHTEGRETEWENANTKNLAILTYVPQFPNDPGPRRDQPSAVPAAELTMASTATDKIKGTIGMFDASIGAQGNETSGRAIIARQRESDTGTFKFIDNLSKAISRIGRLLVEMIPPTYDSERVMRLKFEDETEDYVILNQQVLDEQTNKWVTIHDLNVSKYDVVVNTGPAYSTQRMEAAEAMIQFAQAVPAAAAVMADLIAQNMDWPGSDVITERLKKIMPPEVLTNEEREKLAEDMPEQPEPTPEQQLQMKELEVRGMEADVGAAQAQADMAKSEAATAKAQADTLIAEMKTQEAQLKLQAIDQGVMAGSDGYAQVKELVAQAVAELLAAGKAQ
tara:strand:+ start:9398 stop:11494 length:2097 start_codon:yes stop_codon:yes gene_type:complete